MDTPADGLPGAPTTARQVLDAYAAVAPARRPPVASLVAGDITWLGRSLDRTAAPGMHRQVVTRATSPFSQLSEQFQSVGSVAQLWGVDVEDAAGQPRVDGGDALKDLAARARLGGPDAHLRLGWIVLAGNVVTGGHRRPMVAPLLSCRVGLHHNSVVTRGLGLAGPWDDAIGEWELSPGSDWTLGFPVEDATAAEVLMDEPVWWSGERSDWIGRADQAPAHRAQLHEWIRELAALGGLDCTGFSLDHPAAHEDADGLVACIGYGLFQGVGRRTVGTRDALSSWATVPGIDRTAFGQIVSGPPDEAPAARSTNGDAEQVKSALPLTATQERIVVAARRDAVTVVSGAPGTGKSHLVAAIAADLTAQGQTVLVATRSHHAADVLARLIAREPGPVPIRFGSPEARRAALAEIERRLADPTVSGAPRLLAEAERAHRALRARVEVLLGRVEAAASWDRFRALAAAHREAAPGLFDPEVDHERVRDLVSSLDGAAPTSTWRRWRAGRALRRTARCQDLVVVFDAAVTARAAAAIGTAGDALAELEDLWPALIRAEDDLRHWTGRVMDDLVGERAGSAGGRRALTALHAALRAGPASRQRLISTLPPGDLARAAPLWLGTLGEVDQLLPRVAAMFDVVVLDEASQIDQPSGALALLRAKRCVVVGDPRQLRHVSFVGDDAQASAFAEADVTEGARFDIRRNSMLDLAAGSSPVRWLPEHHRSVPHLIEFSIRNFYDGVVTLATRHPRNECIDAIDLLAVGDDPVGVVERFVREEGAAGGRSVGVVTPFRELADSIAERVLASTGGAALVEQLDLQIGTVHEFQGSERDLVVVVPGLEPGDRAGRRAFVDDPHLFNVMVTRARRRMVVTTELAPGDDDLVARFLRWADAGPPPVPSGEPLNDSAGRLGAAIDDAGAPVRFAYPVGGWTVDLCVGTGTRAIGVMCGVHPDGVDAHIERHLALTRSGWRLRDVVLDGGEGVVELAVELAGSVGPGVHADG